MSTPPSEDAVADALFRLSIDRFERFVFVVAFLLHQQEIEESESLLLIPAA